MVDRVSYMSPKAKARTAGAFYLATMVLGVFAQGLISDRLVMPGDAAATATNILAHESLYRLGFALYLIEMTCQITMTALFYDLLKPVSRSASLLAAVIGLTGCVIKTVARLFFFAPLILLGGAHYLSVFTAEQLRALAFLLLNVNDLGAGMALAFFGFSALVKGWLIVRSTFLPRVLGVLSLVTGLSLLTFLSPPLGNRMFPYIAAIGLVATVAQILWLLVVGVNEQRWKEQASAAAASIWR
jgi:Domain of unknown function (DUF4386)